MSVVFNPTPRRILVRGVNWLGDAVMTTPALLRLREKFPAVHIALLTPEKLKDLWLHHPAIDETISFSTEENVFSVSKKLRAEKFDLALMLPNSPRSALEVFLAGILQRVGYARPWRNFFLTRTIPSRADAVKMHKRSETEIRELIAGNSKLKTQNSKLDPSAHQIYEYLNLTAALGANPDPLAPKLFARLEEIEAVKKKFGLENIPAPIFGLNPGAEYGPAKRWPVEKFIAAAQQIQQRTDCVWILFGGKGDVELGAQIEAETKNSKLKIQNLIGQTSLRELMALLKLCRVLLTNDTGPMHVAAALGTPVVVPFGSTSPELTAPGLPGDPRNHLLKSDAPCSPCFLRECPIDFRCMNGISVERVVAAVVEAAKN
jgi:heptosyltransferase II